MTNRFNDAFDFIVGTATNEEMENLILAIKERRAVLARRTKMSIRVGSAVKFTHRSVVYTGKVMSVKVKKAVVECAIPNAIGAYDSKMRRVPATVSYNVPFNMLEAA